MFKIGVTVATIVSKVFSLFVFSLPIECNISWSTTFYKMLITCSKGLLARWHQTKLVHGQIMVVISLLFTALSSLAKHLDVFIWYYF